MLAIVDQDFGIQAELDLPDGPVLRGIVDGDELDLAVYGGGEGGEDIGIPVLKDIALHLRDSVSIQNSLRTDVGRELLVAEDEELGQHAQGDHADVVFHGGLGAADAGEGDGASAH